MATLARLVGAPPRPLPQGLLLPSGPKDPRVSRPPPPPTVLPCLGLSQGPKGVKGRPSAARGGGAGFPLSCGSHLSSILPRPARSPGDGGGTGAWYLKLGKYLQNNRVDLNTMVLQK